MMLQLYVMTGIVMLVSAGLLDKLEKAEVREISARLEEEKAKRLLLTNDVEMIMLKMEQLERRCNTAQTSAAPGHVETLNMTEKVFFNVRLTATTPLDMHHVIIFDQVLHNNGNGYSANTGVFKAPVAGTYVFSLAILTPGKGLNVHVSIMKNRTEIGRLFTGSDVASWADQGSVTAVTSLLPTDEVFVWEFASSGTANGDFYCSFNGFQI